MTKNPSVCVLLAASAFLSIQAQSPKLFGLSPLLIKPGTTTTVVFAGENLSGDSRLWLGFPGSVTVHEPAAGTPNEVSFDIGLLDDFPPSIGVFRIAAPRGLSDLGLLVIDRFPAVEESGSNNSIPTAQPLPLPVAVDGACDDLRFDYFRIELQRGQHLAVDVVAHRIGSELDPVLRLLTPEGRELAYCDDAPGAGADARIAYTALEAGAFILDLRDIRYQGGRQYRYVLRAADSEISALPMFSPSTEVFPSDDAVAAHPIFGSEPNSTLETATHILVPARIDGGFEQNRDKDMFEFEARAGERLVFKGRTRSLGSPCDLFMSLLNEGGSQIAEADISGANEGTLIHSFEENGRCHLLVEELNQIGGPGLEYQIAVAPYEPGFDLSVDREAWEVPAEGTFEMKVSCERRDYSGPITLAIDSAQSEFELSNNLIPSNSKEAQIKVSPPKSLKPGELIHFTLTGYAKIGDRFFETRASTVPALRKLFPKMLYPIRELDGLMTLGVTHKEEKEESAEATSSSSPRE